MLLKKSDLNPSRSFLFYTLYVYRNCIWLFIKSTFGKKLKFYGDEILLKFEAKMDSLRPFAFCIGRYIPVGAGTNEW